MIIADEQLGRSWCLWAAVVEHFGCGCGDYSNQAEAGTERGGEKEHLSDY